MRQVIKKTIFFITFNFLPHPLYRLQALKMLLLYDLINIWFQYINMDEIVAKMGNVFNVPVDKVKAYRLGKGGQHPAPIKLCFDNEKSKN